MPRQNSWPLTLVVAALGVTATLVFWQASERGLREATDRTIERVTIEVKNEIAARIEAHNRALERLALRWIHQQGTPNDLWEMDVQGYLEDFPGHQAIEWVDSDFRVRWIVPLKGNEAAQGLDLGFEPRRRRAMERARDKRSTTMTRPIDLVQGGRGMLTYVPLYSEDKFDGFMLGVYRIESLFGHVLSSDRIARGYGIEVSIDGETVFERPTSAAQHGRKWTRGSALTLYSVPFELSVWPSDATLVRMRSELPWLVLFSGLAVTALITGISHLGRIVWARSLQLERTNREIREHSAQRELAQAELSRHDLAIAGAFDGIAILDPDGCYNYMNHAYARIYGYDDPEDLIGMRWQTLYFPEEVQAIEDKAFPALAEHRRWHSELTGKRADGERFDVEVSLTSLDDGGMVCVCRDITARKTAEHAVRESEQRLQGILDNTSAVVYMKDLHGRYMLINQRFERLFGVTRDHVRGKTDHDLFQTEVADAFRANDIAVAEKGDVLQIEETAPHDDGLHTYVSIKFPMRDTAGFTYAVAGISTDITDLKRAEIALRESEQRFELAVRGSQDGLWDWLDVTGDQVWWSPRFYELLGYEPGEIPAGMAAFKDLLHPDDLDETMRAVREHFQQNVRYDIEYRLRCKDGRHRWFRARGATVRDESGKPLRMAGSIQDVHERKLAQNELQRSARQLEESNRELENFVYTVSHDLKSPLVTFMGFLSHLKSDVEQGRTDKLIEYSAYMQRAAVRMKKHHQRPARDQPDRASRVPTGNHRRPRPGPVGRRRPQRPDQSARGHGADRRNHAPDRPGQNPAAPGVRQPAQQRAEVRRRRGHAHHPRRGQDHRRANPILRGR